MVRTPLAMDALISSGCRVREEVSIRSVSKSGLKQGQGRGERTFTPTARGNSRTHLPSGRSLTSHLISSGCSNSFSLPLVEAEGARSALTTILPGWTAIETSDLAKPGRSSTAVTVDAVVEWSSLN